MTDVEKKGDQALPRNPSRTFCPLLDDALEECLCRDMRSVNVAAVIRLCGGNFEACEIYRKRRWKRETES